MPAIALEVKMSATAPQEPQVGREAAPAPDYYEDDERGYGWVVFAGTLLLLIGSINVIQGIAAIVLILGACQFLVGLGVFVKNQFSRWTGVVVLAANTIAQLLIMPAYPFWSLTLIAMDILAIYGLIAYGKRISEA
jgi:hypothetical protein